jgi:hypothetical protein
MKKSIIFALLLSLLSVQQIHAQKWLKKLGKVAEMLPKILTNFEKDVETLDGSLIDMDYLETADISKDNPKLVLYQLGFLTIKDVIGEAYRLGFPNREVNGFPPLR